MTSPYSAIYSATYAGISTGVPTIVGGTTATNDTSTHVTSLPYAPSAGSVQVPYSSTDGNWLIAAIVWSPIFGSGPGLPASSFETVSFSVADDAHNWWEPIGEINSTSPAGSVNRVSLWAAPAAKAITQVMVAPSGPYSNVGVALCEVAGIGQGYSVSATTSVVSGTGTSITASLTSSQTAIFFSALTASNSQYPYLNNPANWYYATGNLITNDHNTLQFVYNITTGTLDGDWTNGTSTWMAEAFCYIVIDAAVPQRQSQNWPAITAELAVGYGALDAPYTLAWTDVTSRFLSMSVTQGRQYQLSSLQGATGSITLDNPDGALTVPGTGVYSGINSGTPFRVRSFWTGGSWQVEMTPDGTSSYAQIDSGLIFPVTPGVTYSFGAWIGTSAPWSGGFRADIRWHDAGGTIISTVSSTTITGPTPELVTVSGEAPATAATTSVIFYAGSTPPATITFFAAAAPVNTSAGQVPLIPPPSVAWTFEGGAVGSILAPFTPDRNGPPVITPWAVPFSGYAQQWQQKWDPQTLRGYADVAITDAFSYMTGYLQPVLEQEILNDIPYAYWPCTDAAGAQSAANLVPGNSIPLAVAGSKYGSGPVPNVITQAFAGNSSAILGAQGILPLTYSIRAQSSAGMWGQTLPSTLPDSNGLYYGYSLTATDGEFPSLAVYEVTFEFFFQAATPYATFDSVLFSYGNEHATVAIYIVGYGTTYAGNLYLVYTPSSGGISGQISIDSTDYYTGAPLTLVSFVVTSTTWKLYINSVQKATGSFTGIGALTISTFTEVQAGGAASVTGNLAPTISPLSVGKVQVAPFSGYIGHVAIFDRALPQPRMATHYQAGVNAMAGDSVSGRIERLMQGIPFLGRRAILQDSGFGVTQVASCQDVAGQPASQSIDYFALNTIPGQLYNAPCGDIFYQARTFTWNESVRWLVGDRPDLGELPYGSDIQFSYDPQRVLNSIQLTQLDREDVIVPSGSILVTVTQASQQQYGTLSYWQTGYLEGDLSVSYEFGPGLYDFVNWLAATKANPQNRLIAVSVNAATTPATWQYMLNACPSDTIQVNRRLQVGYLDETTVIGRISQTTRHIAFLSAGGGGGTVGSMSVMVDAMPEYDTLAADDPVHGQLNGTNVIGW